MIPHKRNSHLLGAGRLLLLPALLLTAACSDLGPTNGSGGVLVGSWGSSDAILTADRSGAALAIPCINARFEAIRLNDTLGFQVTGVVTRSSAIPRPGDPYTLSGRLLGHRLVIPYQWTIPGPGADTLRPGTTGSDVVCNA